MTQTDTLGRRSRLRPQSTGKRVTLQERDWLWLRKLHEHGPLPSSFLLQFARDSHRSEKRARERLTDLFNEDNTPYGAPYLARPPQQFRTIDSRYNQLVYDLTPASEKALKQAGHWNDRSAVRSGPWLHGFMVSCITASMELAERDRDDIRYLPQTYLLERAGTDLRYPTRVTEPASGHEYTKDLIPDALFGLEYKTPKGSRYRCFLVEADRSTEPARSQNFNRKSWQRSLQQYEHYLGRGLFRAHLDLKAPLLVLIVLTDETRRQQLMRLVAAHAPDLAPRLLFATWEDFGPVFRPPSPNAALMAEPWERVGMSEVCVGLAAG